MRGCERTTMSTRSIAETDTLRRLGLWFTVVLLLLLAGFIALSLTYQPRSRRFPLLVAVPSFLCIALIALSYFSGRAHRTVERFNAALFEADDELFDQHEDVVRERWIARSIAWVVGMLVAYFLFGFVSMTFVFVLAYLRVEGDHGLSRSTLIALVTTAFAYGLFVFAFGVRLDGGVVTVLVLESLGLA